ncbi:NUDIX domain-containing protein [Actinomycetospora sp. NBRC 106378]|uniref:NUDIX hydrolase n=1 Tax=Actinomycetospora sp. NBRC 106378 TaxID=3032208 RepID=UPI0024A382C2|nr:NUDIX domain-containing protein [Actinomycetospora sp. NBRC 106378]GLZ51505.1 NUDIX hydrolase [Actinomycetospora sp. NBRC 106378]
MARVDYYNDPTAPRANSLVPSVTAAARDDRGRILLVEKVDNGFWALPGGAMELGESIRDAAIREVEEETGVHVGIIGLVGIYTDPRHVMEYDDGEVRQEFSVCFRARPLSGEPRKDGTETKAARWVDPVELSGLSIHPSMRRRIDAALAGGSEPEIV